MSGPRLRQLARPGVSLSRTHPTPCPRDSECSCLASRSRLNHPTYALATTPQIVGCNIPDCHEVEQLKALQRSLDHFTDYEHYERCCDGHHHGVHGVHGEEECCTNPNGSHCGTTDQCVDYSDDCDECADEHKDCYDEVEVCDDDCEQCEVECEQLGHEPEDCPHDHPTTRDNCTPLCDLEQVPLPQLGPTNDFDAHAASSMMCDVAPCMDECGFLTPTLPQSSKNALGGPMFDSDMDHWHTFVQAHHCAPDPCIIGQPPQSHYPQHLDPSFGFTFGCDPTIPANQYPWQKQISPCNVTSPLINFTDVRMPQAPPPQAMATPSIPSQSSGTDSKPLSPNDTPSKICEWIMPCGSICGAVYSRNDDLKKHIKNSHSTKGTVACRWKSCTASFATEAALTGHISKKHLTVSDEEGAWKCTYPGCTKSFMYKQVRDDHLASHNGGNRMHCPICHQWLNCEGSNFRRHMASHGPKNEYMKCRFENLGCKKRFPRLDNLRRHESCCKFGKKAAGVHHHHHRVHIGHTT